MILFVCQGNMVRSQIAKAFLKRYCPFRIHVESCGTCVAQEGNRGKTLAEIAEGNSLVLMLEYLRDRYDIDLRSELARQITPSLVENAVLIVVMAKKDKWPSFLREKSKNSSRVIYWKVSNPRVLTRANIQEIISQILRRIFALRLHQGSNATKISLSHRQM